MSQLSWQGGGDGISEGRRASNNDLLRFEEAAQKFGSLRSDRFIRTFYRFGPPPRDAAWFAKQLRGGRAMTRYTCPVCAYSQMPYSADEGNICPCCGTEFGYDNTMGVTFRMIRDRWVVAHTPWFSPLDTPPTLWSGIAQLILADYEFTWPEWLNVSTSRPTPVSVPGPRLANAQIIQLIAA